jgi:signal transduction histidine kinase
LRILVTGASPKVLTRLREKLHQEGVPKSQLELVPELDSALDLLEKKNVDVVLLKMPGDATTGTDRLARFHQEMPELPIVALVGEKNETARMELIRAGAQEVIASRRGARLCLAAALAQAWERQHHLNHLKGFDRLKFELLSTASHELRTPLAIIREYVSLVYDGIAGPITPEQVDCLSSALRNCDRLSALINDLLDLSKIETGNLRLKRRKSDLSVLLQEAYQDFQVRCQNTGHQLELEAPSQLPAILCDRDKINQVLVNLLGNAMKYTPEGGRLWLRARQLGDYVRVEIQDTGIGITQRNQALIFEAFTQIDRQEGPGPRGTGLGLTISKHIVHLHGGEIGLSSELGQGSLFYFTLPVHQEEDEIAVFIGDHLRLSRSRNKPLVLAQVRVTQVANFLEEEPMALLRRFQQAAVATFRDYRDECLLVDSVPLLLLLVESDEPGGRILLKRIQQLLPVRIRERSVFQHALAEIHALQAGEAVDWIQTQTLAPLAPEMAPGRPQRVLVIDDEEIVLRMISSALSHSRQPLKVLTTTSGYEGCIRFGEFEPDLVILDLVMPEIDGVQVLKSMLQNHRPAPVKFLAVSGHPERKEEMLSLGCHDFLAKPFGVDTLLERVEALLASS